MLASFARRCSTINLGVHARHMRITRSSLKAGIEEDDTIEVKKTTIAVSVPISSNKRRKATKSGTQEIVVKSVTTETVDVEPASPNGKSNKPMKRKVPVSPEGKPQKSAKRKAMPKMLQTLHTDETLPAIQQESGTGERGVIIFN